MNGIDKFVREAMPIQEEEEASGKPAAKANQYENRHHSDWTEKMDGH